MEDPNLPIFVYLEKTKFADIETLKEIALEACEKPLLIKDAISSNKDDVKGRLVEIIEELDLCSEFIFGGSNRGYTIKDNFDEIVGYASIFDGFIGTEKKTEAYCDLAYIDPEYEKYSSKIIKSILEKVQEIDLLKVKEA